MKFHRKLEFFLGQGHEYAGFNCRIFEELYSEKDITTIIKPLAFFERTWDEYLFFYHHSGNYSHIAEHFGNLTDELPVKYYILYYLATLLPDEYSPKDMGRYVAVQDDIVMESLGYVMDCYQKIQLEYAAAEEEENRKRQTQERYLWENVFWNLEHFKANPGLYQWRLSTVKRRQPDGTLKEEPCVHLNKEGYPCRSFSAVEYFNMVAYKLAIPKARSEPDPKIRIEELKKTRSEFQDIHSSVTTQNETGRKFPDWFDISTIVSVINIHIENTEIELSGAQAPKPGAIMAQREPVHFEKSYEDHHSPDEELLSISKQENKFWKGLPMQKVVDHFRVMTERKSRNGEYFLTREQLALFLKRGFLKDEKMPVQKINCVNGEKGFVIKRFYELFNLAAGQYGYPNRKQPFINLLTSCFDNWPKDSITAYFKPGKTAEEW